MALTLTPTAFANSQDSQSRHPLIEILSQNLVPDIPFDGQFLTSETTNEQKPNWITHSSGRLCGIYTFGTTAFKFVYTDVNKSQFYSVTITPGVGFTPIEASLCELANGNIGIIYIADYNDGTHKLHRLVLSPTGVVVSADTEIASYVAANVLGSPFVIRLTSGTFLLVYTMVDSPDYKIMMRTGTTADFLTWSVESDTNLSGLTSTRKRYNTSLSQLSTGEISLWFDYEDDVSGTLERYNIFYAISSNDGSTWSSASASVTPYTTFGDVGKHPIVVHKDTNKGTLAYTEQRGAIQMDATEPSICFDVLNPTSLSIDTINRYLYVLSSYSQTGTKILYGVLKINIDTWAIEKCWSDSSTPAFNAAFFNNHVHPDRHHGEQYLMPVGITETGATFRMISVVNGESNTITNYAFETDPTYGAIKNVDLVLGTYEHLSCTWIDYASKKLWCLFSDSSSNHTVRVGWIDLTEVINPIDPASLYHWNNLIFEPGWDQYELMADPSLLILPEQDFVIVSFGNTNTGATWIGRTKVYYLGDGGIYKDFNTSNPSFPLHGLKRVACKNGKIYGGFTYEPNLGEVNKRGLCEIDIVSSAITLHRPSWATVDDYGLNNIYASSDGRLFITTSIPGGTGYGITIYDIPSDTWTTPFTNTTLPGLSPGNPYESYDPIIYDETTGLVFTAPTQPGTTEWVGVICFSAYGYIRRSYKMEGTYAGGVWTFLTASQLVQGLEDYDLVMALDASKDIYAFWTNQAIMELSIKWDKETSTLDISPYIVRGSEVIVKRTINGDPATLEFEASHGHLFDPHNLNSLWAIYLKKFRKLNLKFGETIFEWTEDNTGSTYDRGDFTAINAFFWSSLDLSTYKGTDLGSTPNYIELIDGAGKKATGYIGAVGAGETLGSEIATGILIINKLYKITVTEMDHFGSGLIVGSYFISDGTETCNANNKVKQVTDPPATAVHIISSFNGIVRNWAYIESGFDPNDIASWKIYPFLGVDYWQQAGVFFVKQVGPVNYERPQYPTIKIVAEDNLGMWEFANVVATDSYSTYPKDILLDLIPDVTNLELTDIDPLLNFDDSVILYQQWVETPVKDIINQICERFGYYPRFDVNGKFTAKKISDSNPTDHIYSDLTKIIRFSPDDSYSDYTNRIVVMGEGRDWLEVLYNEEPVGQQVTGSTGWWGKSKKIYVWYSDDHQRRCRYPRMVVNQSVKDGPYLCDFGYEYIYSIRGDETGLTVRVVEVDLEAQVIATLILYFVLMIVCGALSWVPGVSAGCAVAQANTMFNLMTAVNSVTMYSYNFYAQPVGKVRQSFQANADDVTLQTEIGMIVERKFEDPLCYTLQQCQFVADFEMMVTKLQRNRVTFDKMADLRDEEGDIIQVLHPFSLQAMRILITDLNRKFKVSSSPGSNDGVFLDSIEGWKL